MHAKPVKLSEKLRARHSIFLAVAGLLLHLAANAQQPLPTSSADALLRRVDDHYNRLSSLRTRYTESYDGMGMSRTESGTLLLKKPGRMRWQYDRPAGKVFLLDGKDAWFYTPGDPQVQRIDARHMDDLRTPLRFLLGHTELKKEMEGIMVVQIGALLRISGVPRRTRRLQQLVLEVTPMGEIQSMSIAQQDGSRTKFKFFDASENVQTSADEFRFRVPAGVTVVNGAPPL